MASKSDEMRDTESATSMRDVLDRWRPTARTVPRHQTLQLNGHPIAWWFDPANATTIQLMEALKSDSSLVTPGNPDTSTLFTVYLRPARPMGSSASFFDLPLRSILNSLAVEAPGLPPPA